MLNPYLFRKTFVVRVNSLMVVSCDDIITLSATVEGQTVGLRYEWVQLSGLPIEWLESAQQLEVMIRQTTIRDDKVFRFYVNRGTVAERYGDLLVTATPRDTAVSLMASSTAPAMRDWVEGEQPTSLRSVPGYSVYGQANANNSTRILVWTNPNISYLVENEVVSNQGRWFAGTRNYYVGATIGQTYHVETTIGSTAARRITYSNSITLALDPIKRDIDASEGVLLPVSGGGGLNVLETISRELSVIENPLEDCGVAVSNTAQPMAVIETITRELVTVDEDQVAALPQSTNSAQLKILEILKLDISSLG